MIFKLNKIVGTFSSFLMMLFLIGCYDNPSDGNYSKRVSLVAVLSDTTVILKTIYHKSGGNTSLKTLVGQEYGHLYTPSYYLGISYSTVDVRKEYTYNQSFFDHDSLDVLPSGRIFAINDSMYIQSESTVGCKSYLIHINTMKRDNLFDICDVKYSDGSDGSSRMWEDVLIDRVSKWKDNSYLVVKDSSYYIIDSTGYSIKDWKPTGDTAWIKNSCQDLRWDSSRDRLLCLVSGDVKNGFGVLDENGDTLSWNEYYKDEKVEPYFYGDNYIELIENSANPMYKFNDYKISEEPVFYRKIENYSTLVFKTPNAAGEYDVIDYNEDVVDY